MHGLRRIEMKYKIGDYVEILHTDYIRKEMAVGAISKVTRVVDDDMVGLGDDRLNFFLNEIRPIKVEVTDE
jgi:hypothetical protein